MAQRTVEIAGAGFAGLAVAAALAQHGWKVRVHEQASEVRAFGAGIWIWENGIHVLASIGAADEAFHGRSVASEFIIYDQDNRVLSRSRYEDLTSTKGVRVFIITRQRLLMSIYHAALRAGVEVVTRSKVVGATPDGSLHTESGGVFRADLVIGADGVHSPVRESLQLLKSRRRHVDGAIRLLLPHLENFADTWNDDILRSWWSGRRRVLYNPCDTGLAYFCFTAPIKDVVGSAIPMNKASWKESFPHLSSIIDRIGDDLRYDAFVTTKLHRWSKGRVAIVGDAAHSMTPGLGQGCGMSLVNGLALANFLEQAPNIDDALARWEVACRPLTEHAQFWSAYAWPKSRWPMSALHLFFKFPIWGPWTAKRRMIPAKTVPIGADPTRRWYPETLRGSAI